MLPTRLILSTAFLGSLLATAYADLSKFSDSELELIRSRKNQLTIAAASTASSPMWIAALQPNGTWTDVDYTSGCPARTANWPASVHWDRILALSSSWASGLPKPSLQNSTELLAKIQLAMHWWFDNDFTNLDCVDQGGKAPCPCATPGMWNKNWFDQVILIPRSVGKTCLLLKSVLSQKDTDACIKFTSRAYNRIDTVVNGIGLITGANTLDLSAIGISLGVLSNNATLVSEAFGHASREIKITSGAEDGIKADGSFFQHDGLLYTGNYGKDFMNDFIDLQIQSSGTPLTAGSDQQKAFTTLFEGTEWMTFMDAKDNVLHWQFSVLGRMISFPIVANQASANVAINISEVVAATSLWNNSKTFSAIAKRLTSNATSANAGHLNGNRYFWNADYMVHRRDDYVITLKMFSTRTRNAECVNNQNPFGLHLSDGAIFTYLKGDDYKDVFGAWDWDLVPGITVDYRASLLRCNFSSFYGKRTFVGAASNGKIGVAAQDFLNPLTGKLSWNKAFFFFGDVYAVLASNITAFDDAPVYTVLDQRKWNGDVLVSGTRLNTSTNYKAVADWLHHDNIGYVFHTPNTSVSVSLAQKAGNWSNIGITALLDVQNMFTAHITHSTDTPVKNDDVAYTVYPGVTLEKFAQRKKKNSIEIIENTDEVMAVKHTDLNVVAAVFRAPVTVNNVPLFGPSKGVHTRYVNITKSTSRAKPYTVSVDNKAIIFTEYDRRTGKLSLHVADPTQLLSKIVITVSGLKKSLKCPSDRSAFTCKSFRKKGSPVLITVALPKGMQAGATVSGVFSLKR